MRIAKYSLQLQAKFDYRRVIIKAQNPNPNITVPTLTIAGWDPIAVPMNTPPIINARPPNSVTSYAIEERRFFCRDFLSSGGAYGFIY